MGTEIKVWQVHDGKLVPVAQSMAEAGRREPEHLQRWIESEPSILGEDVLLVGSQVPTRSGPLDLLGIDTQGNTVIVELKRDLIPREALAQAPDYASDVAAWDVARISEECVRFRNQPLEDYLSENLPEGLGIQDLTINQSQRMLLVGTQIEEPLARMIKWLSEAYQVPVNALLLTYITTESGDELLARTMVVPEETDKARVRRRVGFATSDEPGSYDLEELRKTMTDYLRLGRATPRRIRRVLLPLCLDHEPVTRSEIKQALVASGEAEDDRQSGFVLTTISREIGIPGRDYLRQVIRYEKPEFEWEKDNYRIAGEYKDLVRRILEELQAEEEGDQP